MKLTPVASPMDIKQPPSVDLKAKAIEAFNKGQSSFDKPAPTTGQAQETAVANPNKISPEEMSAVKAPSQAPANTDNSTTTEVEATPPAQAPEEKPAKTSQEWAKLARQAKQIQAERVKLQNEQKAIEQQKAQMLAREAEIAQKSELNQKGYVSIESLKADPLSVLAEAGVPYEQITEQVINPSKIDPRLQATINALKAEIADLKKSTAEGNERISQQSQEQYKAAVKQIELDVKNLVNTDPNFETVKTTGSVRDVVELIEEIFKKDGYVMTVEDATTEVENYLVDEAMKLTKIEKIKRKLTQPTANGAPAKQTQTSQTQTQGQGATQPQMKTLTNAASSTRKLSARERAVLAFRGELK
jgi:hypothetical protein